MGQGGVLATEPTLAAAFFDGRCVTLKPDQTVYIDTRDGEAVRVHLAGETKGYWVSAYAPQ
jgi:hypothetical protein